MQRQERHGHQELIAALTGQQASWWYKCGGGDDLPQRLSDERSQRDMAALIHWDIGMPLGQRMFDPSKMWHSSFKTGRSSLLCKFHIINYYEQLDTYNFADFAYADDAAILVSDQLQADSVLQSFNAFIASVGSKLSCFRTKTPKRGCRWPAVDNSHKWCTSWKSRWVRLPWQ